MIHIRKHESIPDCGSFEVWFEDGRPSRYFYWEDVKSRRLRPEQMTQAEALEKAMEYARGERDKAEK